MNKLVILLASATSLFATDQAIVLGTQNVTSSTVTAQAANAPCRIEIPGITFTYWPNIIGSGVSACGVSIRVFQSSGISFMEINPGRPTGGSWPGSYEITLTDMSGVSNYPANQLRARMQVIPSGAGGTIEILTWDNTGKQVENQVFTYTGTSGTNSPGAAVAGASGQNTT